MQILLQPNRQPLAFQIRQQSSNDGVCSVQYSDGAGGPCGGTESDQCGAKDHLEHAADVDDRFGDVVLEIDFSVFVDGPLVDALVRRWVVGGRVGAEEGGRADPD